MTQELTPQQPSDPAPPVANPTEDGLATVFRRCNRCKTYVAVRVDERGASAVCHRCGRSI